MRRSRLLTNSLRSCSTPHTSIISISHRMCVHHK